MTSGFTGLTTSESKIEEGFGDALGVSPSFFTVQNDSMRKDKPLSTGEEKQGYHSFTDIFKVAQNGRLKSTLMLYSFSMAFVIMTIYAGSYLLLLRPLDSLLSGKLPLQMVSWIEGLVPALLGTFVCVLLQLRIRQRRMMPFSFMWLVLMVLSTLLILLSILEKEDRLLYLSIAAPMALLPLAVGTAVSLFIYFRWHYKANISPNEERIEYGSKQE